MPAPTSTERISPADPNAGTAQGIPLRVSEVIAETTDAVSLVFDLSPEQLGRFHYRPGQFLTLRIPSDLTGSVARCYSLCSSPATGEPLRVTVKRTTGGYASNWICDNVEPGSELVVLPPSGSFVPSALDADLLLFAAGSGVTPVMSILTSALAAGDVRCALFYANRDEGSVIFRDRLRELEQAHPERLTVVHWLEDSRGLPNRDAVSEFAQSHPDRPAYACGPGPFMELVRETLHGAGRKVRTENFVSLARNPFEEPPSSETSLEEPPSGRTARVSVDLFGEQMTLDWPEQTPLLDLLLDKGLDAPYACREATCASCVCRVVKGEVRMLLNDPLEPEEIAEGYILACQALPVSDEVQITYD